jgi:hypothetical protein
LEDAALAKGDEPVEVAEEQALDIEHIKKRLDMLDQRLDNIDSMVTAIAERVMSQLVALNITCPHCGKDIEIAIVGSQKLKGTTSGLPKRLRRLF